MTDISWNFPTTLDLSGAMTLVLARRTSASKLVGRKVEFADEARTELRDMARRTVGRIGGLEKRDYEPSLQIGDGEYLAVPDQLVRVAAAPLRQPTPRKRAKRRAPDGDSDGPAAQQIETDPQVRALLRDASGLDLLAASELASTAKPFTFYALVIGNQPAKRVSFVRKTNPVKSLGTKHWFSFGERLTRVQQPLLVLDDTFDLVVTAEGIAVLNQPVFESLFRDTATLVERYPTWAKAFATLGLNEQQTADLVEKCRRDSRLANRLRQIHESGHLAAGKVKVNAVLEQADRVAGGSDRFIKDGRLDFSNSDVSTLLKLLNDDLFEGGLSKQIYEAGSKSRARSR